MLQIPATIESIATRSDGTIKIIIGTQELSPQDAVNLFVLKGKIGWFLFKDEKFNMADIPKEPAKEFSTDKTASQRLRAVLYVLFEQQTDKSTSFQQYYETQMEKFIDFVKEKLN